MKIYLLIIILVGFTFIGFSFTKKYRERLKFFTELYNFCSYLESQIKFSKNNLTVISNGFSQNITSKLKLVLDKYFNENRSIVKVDYLSDKENEFVSHFLKSLGKYDVSGEIGNVKNYQEQTKQYVNECTVENEKYGSLGLKLGFIAGLLIGILLI